jgi:glucosyl-dolichyl phosphate glucuronosyltransferase
MTDVSVVICAHDEGRWHELLAAVGSLERQSLEPREVTVVVDRNQQLFQRAREALRARVVENTDAPGLGGARNSGIAASAGSIVAFLDDDAVASEHWLALLAEQYADTDVAGVGGGIVAAWEDRRPSWFPPEFDWVVGCSYLGTPAADREVRNLFGCNMSFRREVLDALRGFRLGYGCDETEFCIRLHQRWPAKKLIYVPEAKVLHHVPSNRTGFQRFLSRCYFEGGSKAVVARLVGARDGLSDERRYTRTVLPAGVRRGVADFARHGDTSGLARAGAIVAGLGSTAAGYAAAMLSTGKAARRRGWVGQF